VAGTKLPLIEVGYQVFERDGTEEFGAVRDLVLVEPPGIVVYIENSGEYTVPLSAITAVHSGKVLVDVNKLPPDVQNAVRHAHDREQF
jgi:hypothetical protein